MPEELAARLAARAAALRLDPLPLLDPAPVGRFRVDSVAPPEHYEGAVARAVERIRAGAFEKIVLAREVTVQAPSAHDAAAVFGVLRAGFASCYVFCAGRGDAAFVAASPELLIRRDGHRAQTVALAGSTRRSADPAVDDHLGEQLLRSDKDREEQAIVVRRIARALRPHAVWVAAPDEPTLIKVANIQHLATPIRAQLTNPLSAIELAGLLHPDARRRRRAARRGGAADPGAWRASTAAGTPAPSAGPTPTTTASSASPCAARCCAAPRRGSTRASASSATPTPPRSSTRPRSSSARCSRSSPASDRSARFQRWPVRRRLRLHRAERAAVRREVGGLCGVDRERHAAVGDAGDLGGVDEAAALRRS